jgi:hypothetical protein
MINDQTLFLLAAAAHKAAPPRPALPAGKLEGAAWALRQLADGDIPAPGDVLLAYDSVTVGAASMATPTASVSLFGVLARALKHAGCTREHIAAIVVKATAAELAGEVDPDAATLEEQVKALRAAFAASLPKEPRAGAVSIKGARLEVIGAAVVAEEPVAQSA